MAPYAHPGLATLWNRWISGYYTHSTNARRGLTPIASRTAAPEQAAQLAASLNAKLKSRGRTAQVSGISTELCFYVEFVAGTTLESLTQRRE